MPAGNYLRPPIEEAICDFTFAFGDAQQNKALDFTLPGKLQSHANLRDEYTGEVRTQNIQSVTANANQPSVSVQNSLFRIQLTTPDVKRIVSIGPVNLGISVLKPYEGWANFKPRIERVLNAYVEIAKPSSLTRLGLRYINRLIIPEVNADAANYLDCLDSKHIEVDGKLAGFMYRSEYVSADLTKIIITQATIQPVDPHTSEFLLDLDVVWDHEPIAQPADMLEIADRLHVAEGITFERLITQRSRDLFDAN